MVETAIDRLHQSYTEVIEILEAKAEISLSNVVEDHFRKAMLLSVASLFERMLTYDVEMFAHEVSGKNTLLSALVRNKAIARQYHSWFDWDSRNANKFFLLFGKEFSSFMKGKISVDSRLDEGIKAFIELGAERNRLVHNDYGSFVLEKTVEDIYLLFKSAKTFVECIPYMLRECSQSAI